MRARREDGGFTIVELMVAMMIMLIITVPLVSSFVLGLRTTTESGQDVQSSVDAQIVSEYFDSDVAGSDSVATSGGCALVEGAVTGTTVLTLTWVEGSTNTVVTYATLQDDSVQAELGVSIPVYKLVRVRCAASDLTTPLEKTSVANQLVARTSPATPPAAVQCDQLPSCASTPSTVTLVLQEASRMLTDKSVPEVFTFGVTAVRKVTS